MSVMSMLLLEVLSPDVGGVELLALGRSASGHLTCSWMV